MNSDRTNSSTPTKLFIQETGQEFEVPVEGSLGLLALGAIGLKAWREKKRSAANTASEEKNNE